MHSFPYGVREVENLWIPLSDGCRLAARGWFPEGVTRAPAVLEWLPYRKRDATRERDEGIHRWLAGHGYACLRIDVRGTGDSDGILSDEYSVQELEDGVAAVAWVAAQTWCTGRVALLGKSWGGIAALQIAARRPPALAAVVTVCSTDDRFATDAHWMGGALLVENLSWGAMLMATVAQPPDPEIVGDRWRTMWHARLENLALFPEIWMRHSTRDAYWRRGSVCEDWAAIECPVLAVGGWADAYTDAVFRLLAGLECPRRGIVGPWAHVYPHEGTPGPAIGFLQETKDWLDRWLRGESRPAVPFLRAWIASGPPDDLGEVAGKCVAVDAWPPPAAAMQQVALRAAARAIPGVVGLAAPPWCCFGIEADAAPDQRADDERSIVFDSEPLAAAIEILGAPVVDLTVAVDRSAALLAVRLCDVAPDGRSHRVAYTVVDLGRDANGVPTPLVSGTSQHLRISLCHAGYVFAPGHRLRVAVSSEYWPVAWPSPEPVTLSITPESTALWLPLHVGGQESQPVPIANPPVAAVPDPVLDLDPMGERISEERDAKTGAIVRTTWTDALPNGEPAMVRFTAFDLESGHGVVERSRIIEGYPQSAEAEVEHRMRLRRASWETEIRLRMRQSMAGEAFRIEAHLEAFESGQAVFDKRWEAVVPRLGASGAEDPGKGATR